MLAEKNETFQDVSEMQTDEIERLRNLPEEKKKLLDAQQIQLLSSRVDKIKIDLNEKTMLCQKLKSEAEIEK